MKKLAVLVLAGVLVCGMLAGCGGSGSDAPAGGEPAGQEQTGGGEQQTAENLSYTLNGEKVTLHAEFAPIADALGEPDSYFESESCAFQGLDKVYTYGSVVVTTYPVENVDYVYTIELKDDTVETAQGVAIGSPKDQVLAAYPEGVESDTAVVVTQGESTLSFILGADGNVANIVYTAVTE